MKYETVIGLEVHAQLLTQSKIFCGCSTKFGQAPEPQYVSDLYGVPRCPAGFEQESGGIRDSGGTSNAL